MNFWSWYGESVPDKNQQHWHTHTRVECCKSSSACVFCFTASMCTKTVSEYDLLPCLISQYLTFQGKSREWRDTGLRTGSLLAEHQHQVTWNRRCRICGRLSSQATRVGKSVRALVCCSNNKSTLAKLPLQNLVQQSLSQAEYPQGNPLPHTKTKVMEDTILRNPQPFCSSIVQRNPETQVAATA